MLELKGLKYLSKLGENSPTENEIINVPVEFLFSSKLQPRNIFIEEGLKELANNISQNGILQPIIARKIDNKYEIVAGERRWRAAKLAGLSSVPIIVKDFDDQKTLLVAITENLQREDLNVLELAEGYNVLAKTYSLTHEQIAELLSKPRVTITNTMRLLSLGDLAKSYLAEGIIDMGHARALLTLSSQEQDKAVQEIVDKKLTVRQTEQYVKNSNIKQKSQQRIFYTKQQIDNLKNALNVRTKKSISITPSSKNEKVKVTIEFDSLEDADNFFSN